MRSTGEAASGGRRARKSERKSRSGMLTNKKCGCLDGWRLVKQIMRNSYSDNTHHMLARKMKSIAV